MHKNKNEGVSLHKAYENVEIGTQGMNSASWIALCKRCRFYRLPRWGIQYKDKDKEAVVAICARNNESVEQNRKDPAQCGLEAKHFSDRFVPVYKHFSK